MGFRGLEGHTHIRIQKLEAGKVIIQVISSSHFLYLQSPGRTTFETSIFRTTFLYGAMHVGCSTLYCVCDSTVLAVCLCSCIREFTLPWGPGVKNIFLLKLSSKSKSKCISSCFRECHSELDVVCVKHCKSHESQSRIFKWRCCSSNYYVELHTNRKKNRPGVSLSSLSVTSLVILRSLGIQLLFLERPSGASEVSLASHFPPAGV